jgi:hypothetical protein
MMMMMAPVVGVDVLATHIVSAAAVDTAAVSRVAEMITAVMAAADRPAGVPAAIRFEGSRENLPQIHLLRKI